MDTETQGAPVYCGGGVLIDTRETIALGATEEKVRGFGEGTPEELVPELGFEG